MAPNPTIMQAIEQLSYRVTVGEVAAQIGLDVKIAQQGLLELATDTGGHLQVAESGDVVYLFPKNFRATLRNKFLRVRLEEWWNKIAKVLFYLVRISFGIVLLLSIVLVAIAIILLISLAQDNNSNNRSNSSSQGGFFPTVWFGPNLFWFFDPNYGSPQYQRQRKHKQEEMNFFEAMFSFLFGDGNPNADLEKRRWQEIGHVILNYKGAVVAEQISPYLDQIGRDYAKEYEDYMLPVLVKFNGQPAVSPEGQIVYSFPELQVLAQQRKAQLVPPFLQEFLWRFSAANSGQILLAIGLGVLNFVGILVLGYLLSSGTAISFGGLLGFVHSIYWLLFGYGVAFLGVPLGRYYWIKSKNRKIAYANEERQERARQLEQANPDLEQKIVYARQFAAQTVISERDLAYTTETDLLEQEFKSILNGSND